MTTAITTRSSKQAALTWDEVDSNFTNLRDTADAAFTAAGAKAGVVGLFTNIPTTTVDTSVSVLNSAGYSVVGTGGARYVSDSLANASLAASYPLCCKVDAGGTRYWRLAPVDGIAHIEQAGALGDNAAAGTQNDQPALQQLVNYCNAVGIKVIRLGYGSANRYCLWGTTRTTDPGTEADDGHYLVIGTGQQVTLDFNPSRRVYIDLRSKTGATLNGTMPGVNFQVVSSKCWRGYFIKAKGHATDPGETRTRVKLTGAAYVATGMAKGSSFTYPASAADGTGWDITQKGIGTETYKAYDADIIVEGDITFDGIRGENIYGGDDTTARCVIKGATFKNTPASGLNPNSCIVDIDATVDNAFTGIEGWTGDYGGRVKLVLRNCYGVYGSSGGWGSLQGGKYGSSAYSTYYAPTRVTSTQDPKGQIDIVAEYCSLGTLGYWIGGRFTGIDTKLVIGGSAFGDGAKDVDLDVVMICDQVNSATPVTIYNTAHPAGDKVVDNVNLRLKVQLTEYATTSAYNFLTPITWYGTLGSNIRVDIEGGCWLRAPEPSTTVNDFHPSFSGDIRPGTQNGSSVQNVQTTPAVALSGPVMLLTTTNTGIYTATMPAATQFPRGARVLVHNNNGAGSGTIQFNGADNSGSNVRGSAWVVLAPGQGVWMRQDGTYWLPESYTGLRGQVSVASTAFNASKTYVGATAYCTAGTAVTITVTAFATGNVPQGTRLEFVQQGAGALTLSPAGGVTLNGTTTTTAQYQKLIAEHSPTLDTWICSRV